MTETRTKSLQELLEEERKKPPYCLGQRCWALGNCDYGLACICIWCEKHPDNGTFLRKIYNKIKVIFKT